MTTESKKMNIEIPESISSRTEFKRKFSVWELYRSFVFVPRAMSKLVGNNKSKLVDPHFIERIQLAITEVNGCAACSYQHIKMALRLGMSNQEISSFLSGEDHFIQPEEAKAILLAQHFADSRGFPEKDAYDRMVKEYGEEESRIILSASQVMLTGNIVGLPYSAFQSRLKGRPYRDSSLFYELGMLIAAILCLPFALVHGLIRSLIGLPNERLDRSAAE